MNAVTAQDQQNDRPSLFILLMLASSIATIIVTLWQIFISSAIAYYWLAAPIGAVGVYYVSRLIHPTSVRREALRGLLNALAWIIALLPVGGCLFFIAMLWIVLRSFHRS